MIENSNCVSGDSADPRFPGVHESVDEHGAQTLCPPTQKERSPNRSKVIIAGGGRSEHSNSRAPPPWEEGVLSDRARSGGEVRGRSSNRAVRPVVGAKVVSRDRLPVRESESTERTHQSPSMRLGVHRERFFRIYPPVDRFHVGHQLRRRTEGGSAVRTRFCHRSHLLARRQDSTRGRVSRRFVQRSGSESAIAGRATD
jgi:hypothetical protein